MAGSNQVRALCCVVLYCIEKREKGVEKLSCWHKSVSVIRKACQRRCGGSWGVLFLGFSMVALFYFLFIFLFIHVWGQETARVLLIFIFISLGSLCVSPLRMQFAK